MGDCTSILLQELLGIVFEQYSPPDGAWGVPIGDGQWNGIVGELLAANADLSMSPLSMTVQRALVVQYGDGLFDDK